MTGVILVFLGCWTFAIMMFLIALVTGWDPCDMLPPDTRPRRKPAPRTEPLSEEEERFLCAVEHFKLDHSKDFLSWPEVLQVAKGLGYRKEPLDGGGGGG